MNLKLSRSTMRMLQRSIRTQRASQEAATVDDGEARAAETETTGTAGDSAPPILGAKIILAKILFKKLVKDKKKAGTPTAEV